MICHPRENWDPVGSVREGNDSLIARMRANWVPARFAAGMTVFVCPSPLFTIITEYRRW
jgi:hypothetical protein